jgi:hypothetical protein
MKKHQASRAKNSLDATLKVSKANIYWPSHSHGKVANLRQENRAKASLSILHHLCTGQFSCWEEKRLGVLKEFNDTRFQ